MINILKIIKYSKKDVIFIFLNVLFLGIRRNLLTFKLYSKPNKLKTLIVIIFGIQIGILLTRQILKNKIRELFNENNNLNMLNAKLYSSNKSNKTSIEKLIETLTLTLTLTLALKKYITIKLNSVNSVLKIENTKLQRAYERAFSWEKVAQDAWDENTKYNQANDMGQIPNTLNNILGDGLMTQFLSLSEFVEGDKNKDNKLDYEEYQELRIGIISKEQENIDAIPESNKRLEQIVEEEYPGDTPENVTSKYQ